MKIQITTILVLVLAGVTHSQKSTETRGTAKFLGFPFKDLPQPQGVQGFDAISADAAVLQSLSS